MNAESRLRKTLVVIPTRNQGAALQGVVDAAVAAHLDVLVIDDAGSRPVDVKGATVIRHAARMSRGAAILTGAEEAFRRGMTHIVTVDAADTAGTAGFSAMVSAIDSNPDSVIVGRRRFAAADGVGLTRRLAGFWLRVQTGRPIADVQSGFCAYPVQTLRSLTIRSRGIAFNMEVLTRASWAGFDIREVDISQAFGPAHCWSTGVRLFAEYFVWVMLNVHLTMLSALPWPPRRRLAPDTPNAGRISILHPLRSLRILVAEDNAPRQIGFAVALGVFLGTIPLLFIHSMAILLVAGFFGLNKSTALIASQICMPPVVPALCIELGYLLRHGRFLTELSLNTLGYQAWDRFLEWILGSLFMAPLLAAVFGLVALAMARGVARAIPESGRGLKR
ncbi:MAG: DUF2062 domain-containing protein [bacterium]